MTLSTYIYIDTDKPLPEIYSIVKDLVRGQVAEPALAKCNDEHTFNTVQGQGCDTMYLSSRGLANLTDLEGPESSFVANYEALDMERPYVQVNLDTSYAGVSAGGLDCAELHGEIIQTFFRAFGADNVYWTNEFHGTLHQGLRAPAGTALWRN